MAVFELSDGTMILGEIIRRNNDSWRKWQFSNYQKPDSSLARFI